MDDTVFEHKNYGVISILSNPETEAIKNLCRENFKKNNERT
jgi:hypothetical protein